MTNDELEAIEARAYAAADGPWTHDTDESRVSDNFGLGVHYLAFEEDDPTSADQIKTFKVHLACGFCHG